MFKLTGVNTEGKLTFEQVFPNYVSMKEKEKELVQQGLWVTVTPMTTDQVKAHSELLLKKLIGLHGNSLLN